MEWIHPCSRWAKCVTSGDVNTLLDWFRNCTAFPLDKESHEIQYGYGYDGERSAKGHMRGETLERSLRRAFDGGGYDSRLLEPTATYSVVFSTGATHPTMAMLILLSCHLTGGLV